MISTGYCSILPLRAGAIEPYVYELSKHLSKEHYVDVLGIGSGEEEKGTFRVQTFDYDPELANSLSRIIGKRLAFQLPYNLFLLKSILSIHKKNRLDIIHFHDANSGFAVALCTLLLGVPSVCSVHNEVKAAFPINRCKKVLAVSEYIRSFLINKRKFDHNKVMVLNMAIEPRAFDYKECTDRAKNKLNFQNKSVILFVGRKCPEKGPQVLLDAVKIIIKQKPDLLVVFIGPDFNFMQNNQNTYSHFLQSKARLLSVENNVILKGFVSDEELSLFFNAADVCVFPSIWNEPFGMVALEALMYKKPTVVSDVGGLPEIVDNGKSGLLVKPNDPQGLAVAILRLLNNRNYAQSLGYQGRKNVETKFSYDVVSNRCTQIYESLLNEEPLA